MKIIFAELVKVKLNLIKNIKQVNINKLNYTEVIVMKYYKVGKHILESIYNELKINNLITDRRVTNFDDWLEILNCDEIKV